MDQRPIGVFDSGLGGLTTVRELTRILPGENIVYFGDTGRVPYGTRSRETILKYAWQDIRFLLSKDVKCVIVACNTITAAMGEALSGLPVPTVEVLTPAVRAARAVTKNRRIAVIGTPATVKSGAYQRSLTAGDPDLAVLTVPCPLFVPLVESGFTEPHNPVTHLVAEQYLAPVRTFLADTLILGCTHYPIIKASIKEVMGDGVTLIDSGQEAARAAKELLCRLELLNESGGEACLEYYVSDSTADFAENARPILGEAVAGSARKIDIESF